MSEDDDFTFIQVGQPADQGKEAQIVVGSICSIAINDGLSNSSNTMKEVKVGSLSFFVTDKSGPKKISGSQVQASSDSAGNSLTLQVQKSALKKSTARAKVPFEIGYSQMDWLKLTRTHPDRAGADILMKAVGKDCTSLFNKYHVWVNADFLLEKCLVGVLNVEG